jgi:hypothetical protein
MRIFFPIHLPIGCALFLVLSTQSVMAATCSIDTEMAPELAAYFHELQAQSQKIIQNTKNACGPGDAPTTPTGIRSDAEKTIEVIDKAFSQNAEVGGIINRMIVDFRFRVDSVLFTEGGSKIPVLRDAEMFPQTYKNTLLRTLTHLANTCQLEGSNKEIILQMIQRHLELEYYFKQIAV